VIENPQLVNSLSGATLKAGYQSHYVLTSKTGMPCDNIHEDIFYDEIVVNQETQVKGNFQGGGRAEGRGQRAEGRGQRAEGRGQRAEGRGQREWEKK
jgi:hypothetical protein